MPLQRRSAPHLAGSCFRLEIVEHGEETTFGQLPWGRRHLRVPEKALWRQHDERQGVDREQRRLTSQQVEELRGGRAVGDADVDVRSQLQESLRPRARMIGPLTFEAVRQQQHKRRTEPPLPARGDDELVDHDLRAVDEVAVLRFPDHEPRRLLDVVAVLESDDGVLGEGAVVDLEGGARLRQRLQRHVDPPCDGVVEHRMAMAEGAALDVLAGEPDADAVAENRRVAPVPPRSTNQPCARLVRRGTAPSCRERVRACDES